MKLSILLGFILVFLNACNDDLFEQKKFIAELKKESFPTVDPIPAPSKFESFNYNAKQRSPFSEPEPTVVQNQITQVKDCLQPVALRPKESLEKYPLESLTMKGVIGSDGDIWAIIAATDMTLHRITIGNYLGHFNGKVQMIRHDSIDLIELIPDGVGCRHPRLTQLTILEASTNDVKK